MTTDNREAFKQQAEAKGWTCKLCSCPGLQGFDCAKSNFRGIVIQQRGNNFKIFRNNMVIESAFIYQFDEKLKLHGLTHELI